MIGNKKKREREKNNLQLIIAGGMGLTDTFIVLGTSSRAHGSSRGLRQLSRHLATLTVARKNPSCDQCKQDGVTLTLQLLASRVPCDPREDKIYNISKRACFAAISIPARHEHGLNSLFGRARITRWL